MASGNLIAAARQPARSSGLVVGRDYGIIWLSSVGQFTRLEKSLDHHGAFVFNGETYRVRPVQSGDLETLRVWKNENRRAFHYQEIIDPEQQRCWFAEFANDPAQQISVAEIRGELVACVGFRVKTPSRVELFNLICGPRAYRGIGVPTRCLAVMRQALAAKGYTEIELEVLKSNLQAAAWYGRRGFRPCGEGVTFLRLLLDS